MRREAATYLMGIGRPGGLRPKEWSWKWGGKVYYDSFWIGDVPRRLAVRASRHELLRPDGQPLLAAGPAPAARGVAQRRTRRLLARRDGRRRRAGPGVLRSAPAGEGPDAAAGVRPAGHAGQAARPGRPFPRALLPQLRAGRSRHRHGANVINIHHANELNPFINYPFLATDKLSAYVREAHAKGAKVKIYYTVRELTNHVTEIGALRSLGNEVFAPGGGRRLSLAPRAPRSRLHARLVRPSAQRRRLRGDGHQRRRRGGTTTTSRGSAGSCETSRSTACTSTT